MPRSTAIDPLARQAAVAIASGRVALGASALAATDPALKALGFAETDSTSRALARLAGSRDIALGLLTVAARNDLRALRAATAVSAAVDAADAIAFGLLAREPETRHAGSIGAISGSAAAIVGAWAWFRLG